jgi:hypothetical protein
VHASQVGAPVLLPFPRLGHHTVFRCLRRQALQPRHNRHREVPRLCFLPRSAATSRCTRGRQSSGRASFTPLMVVPHNSQQQTTHRHPHVPRRPPTHDGREDVLPLQTIRGADRRSPRWPQLSASHAAFPSPPTVQRSPWRG